MNDEIQRIHNLAAKSSASAPPIRDLSDWVLSDLSKLPPPKSSAMLPVAVGGCALLAVLALGMADRAWKSLDNPLAMGSDLSVRLQ